MKYEGKIILKAGPAIKEKFIIQAITILCGKKVEFKILRTGRTFFANHYELRLKSDHQEDIETVLKTLKFEITKHKRMIKE